MILPKRRYRALKGHTQSLPLPEVHSAVAANGLHRNRSSMGNTSHSFDALLPELLVTADMCEYHREQVVVCSPASWLVCPVVCDKIFVGIQKPLVQRSQLNLENRHLTILVVHPSVGGALIRCQIHTIRSAWLFWPTGGCFSTRVKTTSQNRLEVAKSDKHGERHDYFTCSSAIKRRALGCKQWRVWEKEILPIVIRHLNNVDRAIL